MFARKININVHYVTKLKNNTELYETTYINDVQSTKFVP